MSNSVHARHSAVLLVVLAALLMCAGSAKANVASVSGNIELVPAPADARIGQFESDTNARVWNEAQDYTLANDLTIDNPTTFHASGTIPAGTVVDSHMIHSDIVGTAGTRTYSGTVTFSSPVLGVIINNTDLDRSDFLGAPTMYSSTDRPADVGSDSVSVSADATAITFHTQNLADEVRVITQADEPTIDSVSGPATVNEGDTRSYSVTASDNDSTAVIGYQWNVTSGNAQIVGSSTGSSASVQFTDGPSTVQLQVVVSDQHGNTASKTVSVAESNVAPTLSALGVTRVAGAACQSGNQVGLGFSFTDPAAALDAPYSGLVDWGDGSPTNPFSSSPVATSHTYPPGTFTISVNVSDKDGGAAQQQTAAVSLLYGNSGVLPPVNADGTSVFKFGSTIPVKIRITDCTGNPVPGLSPEIGTSMSSSLTPSQGVNETPSTSGADTTGHMRYDAVSGQYIYNFASKYLPDPNATYYFYIRDLTIGQVTQKFGVRSS